MARNALVTHADADQGEVAFGVAAAAHGTRIGVSR
jgi:hypothetical protein